MFTWFCFKIDVEQAFIKNGKAVKKLWRRWFFWYIENCSLKYNFFLDFAKTQMAEKTPCRKNIKTQVMGGFSDEFRLEKRH